MVEGLMQGASYITTGQWLSVTDADTRVYGGQSDFRLTSKIKKFDSGLSILAQFFSYAYQTPWGTTNWFFTQVFPK